MSKYAGEEVLVVPRSLFDALGAFHGISTENIDAVITGLLNPENHFYFHNLALPNDR